LFLDFVGSLHVFCLILYSFCEILTLDVGIFSLFFQSSIILTHDILTHNNKIVSSINMFSFLRKINQTCDVTTVSGLVLYWKSLLLKYPFHVGTKSSQGYTKSIKMMGWDGMDWSFDELKSGSRTIEFFWWV
jgi:hypothetical protein